MKLGVYAMRDNLGGFLQPTFELNDQVAVRNFDFACSRSDTVMGFRSSDFCICKIGEFDTELGTLTAQLPEVLK